MKKTLFFLIAVVAIGLMSCDNDSKPDRNVKSDVDMAIIDHGQLQFYNHATQKLTPYEAETDSVVFIAFDNDNHLYYTSDKHGVLELKCIDLLESHPQPKLCANWQLTPDQYGSLKRNWVSRTRFGIFMDDQMENLYMVSSQINGFEPSAYVYNIASGEMKSLSWDEYCETSINSFGDDRFYVEQGEFYYITPEGKVCLNDKIDFVPAFEIYEEVVDEESFSPVNISPDGKKVVYSVKGELEESGGYYCVASSDGQKQTLLDSFINDLAPQWLEDGSMVYAGREPRPESDPEYDAEWNNSRGCIKIMNPQGAVSTLVSDAEVFCVNPYGKQPLDPKEKQASLEGCDMAIIDNGKVTFYNSTTNTFIPFVAEKDYVLNGAFYGDEDFYYTVAIGDELYLKEVYFNYGMSAYPSIITDWELKLDDCYSESCGKAATMCNITAASDNSPYGALLTGIEYDKYEDMCVFQSVLYYNSENKMKTDYWPNEYDDSQEIAERTQLKQELGLFDLTRFDLGIPCEVEENKMEVYTISPSHDCIAYAYYTALGPKGGSGPLCFATVDGKVKMALEGTDVQNICYGWLNDGRLAYSDKEGIKAVAADGTITKIADGKLFVTVH